MTAVYIVSFYANITKIGTRSYHCRFTESRDLLNTKKVMLLYEKMF